MGELLGVESWKFGSNFSENNQELIGCFKALEQGGLWGRQKEREKLMKYQKEIKQNYKHY